MKLINKLIFFFLLLAPLSAQELLVRLDKSYPTAQAVTILDRAGYELKREISFPPSSSFPEGLHIYLVTTKTTALRAQALDPAVVSVTPNQEIRLLATPDDPGYETQNKAFELISAPAGWEVRHDAPEIIVAIIDTGVDFYHPDLAANIWTNPGEISDNGTDDDHNGYIDDLHGWNFVDHNNKVYQPTDDPHGTHVAGIVGAVGNNSLGVTGTAWRVQLMVLKIMGPNGAGTLAAALEAFSYAAHNGAKIANNSWGHEGYSYSEALAIEASNLLYICAAGNEGNDNDTAVEKNYPASYDLDNIIAVAATDGSDRLASFSNYGARNVDLAAPGVDIYSTYPSNEYRSMSGTSMATPAVAGAAALAMAQYPKLPLFAAQGPSIRSLLLESADSLSFLEGQVAYGRLNLARILEGQFLITNATLLSPLGGEVFSDSVPISWQVPLSTKQVTLEYKKVGGSWQYLADVSGSDHYLWDTTSLPGGKYQLQVVVTDVGGDTTYYSSNPFTIKKRQGTIQPLPNPATDQVNFHYQLPEGGELFIYNLKGRLVYKQSLPPGAGSWLWPLRDDQGRSLAGGVYYYHLKEREGSANGKIIVQR